MNNNSTAATTTYLGGLPDTPRRLRGLMHVTPYWISMAKVFRPWFTIRRESIRQVRIVSADVQVDSRFTVTRLALFGPFAFGMPKRRQVAHTMVEIELNSGHIAGFLFEKPEVEVRLLLGDWLYPQPVPAADISPLSHPVTGAA